MKLPTYAHLAHAIQALGYRWFEGGDYNLNLVGVRGETAANRFDDLLLAAFTVRGMPHVFGFDATTDPGHYYRENPLNAEGTAIVVPGQYPRLWQIGRHQGRYPALVQRGPITVYRDNDRDKTLNLEAPTANGFFGINLHKASPDHPSRQVDKWSAGCQVLASPLEFDLLLSLCQLSAARYGNGFTYTLLTEAQLWNH